MINEIPPRMFSWEGPGEGAAGSSSNGRRSWAVSLRQGCVTLGMGTRRPRFAERFG
jgi:hypothetical protein